MTSGTSRVGTLDGYHVAVLQWSHNTPIPILTVSMADFQGGFGDSSVLRLFHAFDTQLQWNVVGLGVSLIDDTPSEVGYLFFEDVEGTVQLSPETQSISAQIGNLQVDACRYTALFPSILYTLRPSSDHTVCVCCDTCSRGDLTPFLHVCGTRHLNQSNCLHIDKGLVEFQRFVLNIDEQSLMRVVHKFRPFLVDLLVDCERRYR